MSEDCVHEGERYRQTAVLWKSKRILIACLCAALAGVVFSIYYIKTHPLVFKESFFEHAHCILQTGMAFNNYAADHDGHFPFDTNGYGNALLLLADYTGNFWAGLTGPGYDGKVFAMAAETRGNIPESECGRVYVQGLRATDNPQIALFFDKLPTPGGDHCQGFHRMFAPLAREIWTIGSSRRVVKETDWDAFGKEQVDLLIAAGISRTQAKEYYREKPSSAQVRSSR